MSNWDIREVNVPRLPPMQARYYEAGYLSENYELIVEHKIVATWRPHLQWPSAAELYEVIYKIRGKYNCRDEDIVINVDWPRPGDTFAGVTL